MNKTYNATKKRIEVSEARKNFCRENSLMMSREELADKLDISVSQVNKYLQPCEEYRSVIAHKKNKIIDRLHGNERPSEIIRTMNCFGISVSSVYKWYADIKKAN